MQRVGRNNYLTLIDRGGYPSSIFFFIVSKNQITKDELKIRVLKLKNELYQERYSEGITFIAHKYLNKVIDIIDEYRY